MYQNKKLKKKKKKERKKRKKQKKNYTGSSCADTGNCPTDIALIFGGIYVGKNRGFSSLSLCIYI